MRLHLFVNVVCGTFILVHHGMPQLVVTHSLINIFILIDIIIIYINLIYRYIKIYVIYLFKLVSSLSKRRTITWLKNTLEIIGHYWWIRSHCCVSSQATEHSRTCFCFDAISERVPLLSSWSFSVYPEMISESHLKLRTYTWAATFPSITVNSLWNVKCWKCIKVVNYWFLTNSLKKTELFRWSLR